jgi:hypothetical protein
MKAKRNFGLEHRHQDPQVRRQLVGALNMKLAALGQPACEAPGFEGQPLELAQDLIRNFREKNRLLEDYLPPADQRIQAFLDAYLGDAGIGKVPRLPSNTLVLDRYGLARELSLPPNEDKFQSAILTSYRVRQGILHNPQNDRRTTKGVFHVAEGGLPVPPDKKSVPKAVFGRLLAAAVTPPAELSILPFTALQEQKAQGFVSLLLRPLVSPEVTGWIDEKSMEVRFFAPGNLVSNLDFVESIFGNAGDPYLPENDAGLDARHWTGHTGCIILATHLTTLRKKDLGLPAWADATERQKRDGMAWKDPAELYNDGGAFKICARDERGVMVTLIADNYYGYSKKEVKAHISYSANLMGLAEEEHAGGALAFPRYNLGVRFFPDAELRKSGRTIADVVKLLGDAVELRPEGYALDRHHSEVVYIPEDAVIDLEDQMVSWHREGRKHSIRVLPGKAYVHPSGYRVHMEKHPATTAWRLVGTAAEGTLCHKPCTVSGGGKSEISKAITDAIHYNPITIGDFAADMAKVTEIVEYDYSRIWTNPPEGGATADMLSPKLSLNDVIKLLSSSSKYTPAHNAWLDQLPSRIKALVFLVKRFHGITPGFEGHWSDAFSVDVVNGTSGNIFKYNNRPVMGAYLRIGVRDNGASWTYKLRQDFMPAFKIQWEDDISASVIVPTQALSHLNPDYHQPSLKFTQNCEYRFFQRPDEAVHRGYDKQAEHDLSIEGNFISNFEPFDRSQATDFLENVVEFTTYTKPVQDLITGASEDPKTKYFVVSSNPRIVDGAPSKNPRYLQMDPNYLKPLDRYLADTGVRLARAIPGDKPVLHPINAVLPGRRNNPADHKAGIRPLAVYNPVHYQELPELFMDFICSLTGKSPSTTGAGSEGALTKGPFNALVPTTDLNNALLGFILTGYNGFSSAAGHIGAKYRVEHDVSLVVPELWCRMAESERDPQQMIEAGYLEKINDFDHKGRKVLASRLGYRITYDFATHFLGRLFDDPGIVFNEEILKPELQGLDDFVDGIDNVVEAQKKVALEYFEDGSVDAAIPPLKALIHIMAHGHYNGKDASSPEVRALFDRETVLKSDWYQARLDRFHGLQKALYERHRHTLKTFLADGRHGEESKRLGLEVTLTEVEAQLKALGTKEYRQGLVGTLGADVLFRG